MTQHDHACNRNVIRLARAIPRAETPHTRARCPPWMSSDARSPRWAARDARCERDERRETTTTTTTTTRERDDDDDDDRPTD